MPVTARIIIFLVRDPYEPSFATGTGGGTVQNMLHQFLPMSLLGNRHQNHTWPNHDFEFPADSPSTFLPYLHRQLSVPILWCACMPARLMICCRPSKIQHGSNQMMLKNLAPIPYRNFPGRYLQYIFNKQIWGVHISTTNLGGAHFYAEKGHRTPNCCWEFHFQQRIVLILYGFSRWIGRWGFFSGGSWSPKRGESGSQIKQLFVPTQKNVISNPFEQNLVK